MPNGGGIQFTVTGLAGKNFRVQSATGLTLSNWMDVASVTNAGPLQTWTAPFTNSPGGHFFRVVLP
jgi:hypothetical protein